MLNNFRKITINEFERLKNKSKNDRNLRFVGNKLYKYVKGKNIRAVNFVLNRQTNCYQCLLQTNDAGALISELIK